MKETIIAYRNKIIHATYKHLLKPFFFRRDPEYVHDQMTRAGVSLGKYYLTRITTGHMFGYDNPVLEQSILGVSFKNPIGLSAGFDKNAELVDILPRVGFGFIEVGSITGLPCPGNPKPRLWRLPKSKSLVVYYGLKNDGCDVIAERLKGKHCAVPLGVSVAMTNNLENLAIDLAIKDFAKAFSTMAPIGDYITVNISCPNTTGGQPFIDPNNLEALFVTLDAISVAKPIFIKFSPDLSTAQLDALLEVAAKHRIDGIICTNLTKKKDNPKILDPNIPSVGGMSGKIVQELSDEMLTYVYKHYGTRFVLIGSGGVFTAEDAYRKIRLGASLIQVITGMVFEGPQVISEINQGLVRLLKRDGFASLHDAIGVDNC
jgi:dihydroorotate dehydrogenase